jgi:hypothetical protein
MFVGALCAIGSPLFPRFRRRRDERPRPRCIQPPAAADGNPDYRAAKVSDRFTPS